MTDITYADGGTTLEDITYTLNAIGVRTSTTNLSGTTDWTYDEIYRLTDVEYPTATRSAMATTMSATAPA